MHPATTSFSIVPFARGPARHHPAQRRARLTLWLLLGVALGLSALFATTASAARPILVACAAPHLEGVLNLNTASAEQLDLLPGVGPSTADKIVRYREKHAFRSVRQLMRVQGIGPKTFERLQPYVTVDGDSTLTVVSPP